MELSYKKTVSLFECFPYVCPEPVLVKCAFLCINGSKRWRFLTSTSASSLRRSSTSCFGLGLVFATVSVSISSGSVAFWSPRHDRSASSLSPSKPSAFLRTKEDALPFFSQLSLCLSRACLDKNTIFSIKLARRGRVFRFSHHLRSSAMIVRPKEGKRNDCLS